MGSLFAAKPERQIFELLADQNGLELRKLLAKSPAAANARHPDHGGTPLHLAAHAGWEEGVEGLITAGANVNAPDQSYGALPLHVAITKRHDKVVLQLLRAGTNLSHRHKNGYTPMMVAVEQRQVPIVAQLLQSGKSPMEGHAGLPILAWACLRWEVLRLDHDQDQAAQIVRLLIEHGAEVDRPDASADGWTPLMFAATFGQHKVLELLLEHGADPSRADTKGQRAVDLARASMERSRGRTVELLKRSVVLLGG